MKDIIDKSNRNLSYKMDKKIEDGFIGERRIVLAPNIMKIIKDSLLTSNFYPTAIGYYPNAVNHEKVREFGCPEYILIYCTKGEGNIFVRNDKYTLKPNTYFIIPKYAPHHYFAAENNPWDIYWVHYSGGYDDLLYQRYLANGEKKVKEIPYDPDRIKLFDRIYYLLEHNRSESDLELMGLNLLNFVSSLIYYQETENLSTTDDYIGASMIYMQERLSQHLTINELANQQQISVSHYSRIFKQRTGHTPIHYFNQLKIQKSCQYLYFTDKTIKEICTILGFEDPFYFSRLFTKLMGLSPLNYRKTYRGHSN